MSRNLIAIPILLFLLPVLLCAQQTRTIHGRIYDEDTKEGLPFANVYFESTSTGVTSDLDGNFTLTYTKKADSLSVSAVGYVKSRRFVRDTSYQEIYFYLSPAEQNLSEVVILAGENPANAIVRGIIRNKENNEVTHFNSYQREDYTKVEVDLVNIDERLRKTKLFKPFDFVFNNIDSSSDEKPFLPIYVAETLSDQYYVKGEGKPHDLPKAQRTSGTENQSFVDAVNHVHDELNLYDNWLYIMDKNFASPFSSMGLFYYEYYIMDSSYISGQWSYKLKFKPKRKQENTFYGDFWVADTSFAVERVNMRMSPEVNINLVNRVIVYEEFTLHKDSIWLPAKQNIVVDFKVTEKSPGMIIRKTISRRDYHLNHEDLAAALKAKDPETYDISDLAYDDAFWQKARHDTLSKRELAVYGMVDSIKNVPVYKTYVDIITTIVSGYKHLGKVEIGPYFTIFSNNPVEGYRFRMGVWTSPDFSKNIRFGGYAAYGLKDKQVKYGFDLQWVMSKKPRTEFGFAWKDDITSNSDNSEALTDANLFSGFYRRPVPLKLLHIQEGKIYYERYWKKGWSNRLTLLHRNMDPYGGILDNGGGFNYAYLPHPKSLNDVDTTIATTEIIITTKYAYEEKFLDGDFNRLSLGSKYPIVEFQYTAGVNGLLDGKYRYHKIVLGYHHWFYINPIGWTSYSIKTGQTFGTVPFLLMEVHPGNETYFYDKGSFNGMNRYEFASDRFVSWSIVHHFEGFFLNKVPLLRKLKLREVVAFRGVLGTISAENRAANKLNAYNTANLNSYTGFRAPWPAPYMEMSAGIENIFKVLRIDAVWRLNYLDNPQARPLSLRMGVDFFF